MVLTYACKYSRTLPCIRWWTKPTTCFELARETGDLNWGETRNFTLVFKYVSVVWLFSDLIILLLSTHTHKHTHTQSWYCDYEITAEDPVNRDFTVCSLTRKTWCYLWWIDACNSWLSLLKCHLSSLVTCFIYILSVFGFHHSPGQLSVGLRFSVQRLEDAGPKISFELQIHRWHSRISPSLHLRLTPTYTQRVVCLFSDSCK